jgi:hypothetical protein
MRGQIDFQDGFALEMAMLTQANRDYEELNVRKAPVHLDQKHATDFLVELNGRDLPLGLTLRQDMEKLRRDFEKARKCHRHFVLVSILERDTDRWDLAIDNALSMMELEVMRELKNGGRYLVVYADAEQAQVEDWGELVSSSRRTKSGDLSTCFA